MVSHMDDTTLVVRYYLLVASGESLVDNENLLSCIPLTRERSGHEAHLQKVNN